MYHKENVNRGESTQQLDTNKSMCVHKRIVVCVCVCVCVCFCVCTFVCVDGNGGGDNRSGFVTDLPSTNVLIYF